MSDQIRDNHCIVIGSGFGGAVTACRLAQAGFRVTILERGRRYQQGDFPNLPQDGAFLPDERRWSWELDQGLWDVLDLDEIVSAQAAGYGGGSLVYANVHIRPPASVFDSAWPKAHQGRTKLNKYFDLAASMLEVAPVSAHPPFQRDLVKASQLTSAARRLGRRTFHPPLAIRYAPDGVNEHGVKQGRCSGCGSCCTGCPQSAKNTLDLNYLAIAERYGANVVTQCEVVELVEAKSGGWIVRCFDHLEAKRRTYRAHNLFVCAGSVHSTRLLASARWLTNKARLRRGRKRCYARKLVGVGYFPGGDALGVVYGTDNPQRPSVGPVISTAAVEWSANDGSFFMLQDGGYSPPLERMVGLLRASVWLDRNTVPRPGSATTPGYFQKPQLLGAPTVPSVPTREPSCPDGLLRATLDGSFDEIVPPQLRDVKRLLSERLSTPLLLPAVVGETILGSLRSSFARLGPLRAPLLHVARVIGQRVLGSDASLGVRALNALLGGAHLSPEELASRVVGYDAGHPQHRTVLLAMGRDAALGVLHFDPERKRMVADLNLARLTPGYAKQEAFMADIAKELGGELRTNPAWALLRKPVTVHNQGGCRMSDDSKHGVTDAFGKVHRCRGLYVVDGSILCESVGVNPSATIAALAERAVLKFIRKHKPGWPNKDPSAGAREYAEQRIRARNWAARATALGWDLEPPAPDYQARPAPGASSTAAIGLEFKEQSNGYYSPTPFAPRDRAGFLDAENRGRPEFPIELRLKVLAENLAAFLEDPEHVMQVAGTIGIRLPGRADFAHFHVCEGQVNMLVPVPKEYAIARSDSYRLAAQQHATRGRYQSVRASDPPLRERLMRYSLPFHDEDGRWWALHGYKRIASTTSLDAWRQTSIIALELSGEDAANNGALITRGAGAVHVDLTSFLFDMLPSVHATGGDPVRNAWAVAEFTRFFFGTLQKIYLPALRAALHSTGTGSRLEDCQP